MTVYVCGNCNKQLPVSDARFCNYCGVHLVMEEEKCALQARDAPECGKCDLYDQKNVQDVTKDVDVPHTYAIEDLHSFALRLRERILRSSGNARRGFRTMTDGTDSSAISRERFVNAVRSTWSFAGVPNDLVEATLDKYLRPNNGFISYESFSDFITNGPEKLDICVDEQTVLSSILLPIQEGFLRKHYTPHAAFRSIPSHVQGFVTIQDIRTYIDRYLRIISLGSVSEEVFRDVIQRAANVTGDKLAYNDFSRMLSYPYVGQQQWRPTSTSPRRVETDNHPYRKYY